MVLKEAMKATINTTGTVISHSMIGQLNAETMDKYD